MRSNTVSILRDPALVRAREAWFTRLEGPFAGERQEQAFVLQGIAQYNDHRSRCRAA